MALVVYDRVQEITATTGTGSLTLGGAVAAYQSFSVIGNGNTTYYTILNGAQWEVGIGTYSTTGPTLARTTVLSNSNGNTSPITLVGASTVWCDYPAEKAIYYDANGVATIGTTLGYSDTGIIASFTSGVAGYNQVILQNKTAASNASSNFNVSNDAGTAGANYAEFGINSSIFSNGSGAFNLPGASYLASASTDLAIGTYGAYPIHFVTNSSTTDAMTIYSTGGASLGGLGDPGIGNIAINNAVVGFTAITSASGTTVLTNSATQIQAVTGTLTQTIQLPQATTLLKGTFYTISNMSTGLVTIKDNAGTTLETITTGGAVQFLCASNLTSAGTWGIRVFASSNTTWGNAALNYTGNITGATWQGNTVQSGYGGTGLTTFTAANYALYSTSASALTAGTLPPAAGGTGITSLTANYIPYGNGSSAWQSSSSLQFNGTYLLVGASAVLGGLTNPIIASTGAANNYVQSYIYNSTNGVSSSADFVAYPSNGADTHGWVDMGITSLAYADTTYTVTGPNEAYLFGSAPSSSGTSGNLVFATDNTGSTNAFQWYVGGFTQSKSAYKMQLSSTALTLAGNLAFTGTGNRITGDFSNATASSRVAFQSSTTNGNTGVYVIPNGTATTANITVSNNSVPDNSSLGQFTASASSINIVSGAIGAGTLLPLAMYTSGSERLRIDTSGNVGIGTSSPTAYLSVNVASASNGINVGDFNSGNNTGSIPQIQSLGSRGDGNGTFQGRFGAAYRRFDGTAIVTGTGLGTYAFGGQYGTATTYTAANLLYAASINGVSEGSFTGSTAMPTAITFSTGSTGNSLGSVNVFYGTERMRIDSTGSVLIGRTAKLYAESLSATGYAVFGTSVGTGLVFSGTDGTNGVGGTIDGAPYVLRTNNTERMRISVSGGVSIGNTTDAGATNLLVAGSVTSGTSITSGTNIAFGTGGSSIAGSIYSDANWGLLERAKQASPAVAEYAFQNAGAVERMRIDTNGNFYVGVGSLGWYAPITAITSKNVAIWSNNISQGLSANLYRTTSGYTPTYIGTTYAAEIEFNGGGVGGIQFNVAPSGTSGTTATLTQAMTLFVSGGLSLGNTTDPGASNLKVTGDITASHYTGQGTGLTGFATSLSIGGNAGNVTGVVAVANGGTGLSSTPTNGQLNIGNGSGFTRAALTAGTNIAVTNGAGSISIATNIPVPQVTVYNSGSGTYTVPANAKYITVEMIGGGSGGGGGGISGTSGSSTTGGTTTFGGCTATGGTGGITSTGPGTATLGSGAVGIAMSGNIGGGFFATAVLGIYGTGACGGAGPWGGASYGNANEAGKNAAANSGAGGGGGGYSSVSPTAGTQYTGAGGSAGGYIKATITSLAASYSYAVGGGGVGGTAGTSGFAGGNGGSGAIIVTAFF